MNGVNLGLFQFEYDLTWMSFFMDSHDRFYARYGGREDRDPESHLSKASLLHTMHAVLALHKDGNVQTSRYEPNGKEVRTPEQIPPMKAMMARRKEQCIHCHDVKVAGLRHEQMLKTFDRGRIFTYPAPSAVGVEVDADVQNRVKAVVAKSAAERAGIRAGDELLSVDGHRVLTLGDFTRVLELTPKEARLPLTLRRGSDAVRATLELSGDWRRTADPSWRDSTHVAGPNGGFWGVKLTAEERKKLGLAPSGMALRVTAIWGEHPKKAGLRNGDVITSVDGQAGDLTIRQVHTHLQLHRHYGDTVPLQVHRSGKLELLRLALPSQPPPGE